MCRENRISKCNFISGNEFSTLEGVEFDWSITSFGPNKDLVMVRFMQFKDSPYETPPTIEKIEQRNKRGHIVLLEGIKTGSAKVCIGVYIFKQIYNWKL